MSSVIPTLLNVNLSEEEQKIVKDAIIGENLTVRDIN
jgi:hypothetical protein